MSSAADIVQYLWALTVCSDCFCSCHTLSAGIKCSSSVTAPEHEQVISSPPGFSTRIACNIMALSSAQHSTAQHSTAQHSTAQHGTAQHSTAVNAGHQTGQHKETAFLEKRSELKESAITLYFPSKTTLHMMRYNMQILTQPMQLRSSHMPHDLLVGRQGFLCGY